MMMIIMDLSLLILVSRHSYEAVAASCFLHDSVNVQKPLAEIGILIKKRLTGYM